VESAHVIREHGPPGIGLEIDVVDKKSPRIAGTAPSACIVTSKHNSYVSCRGAGPW
jgi:hypothetical protein